MKMGSNGADPIKVTGDAAECSATTVAIKIKTLDSQTFTLRVDKCVPVPELKAQIASVTGVVSEQQRLICRGKVLKDDQLLSAYHVEDGHTLHLVVRQPVVAQSTESFSGQPATDPTSGALHDSGSRLGPGMVVGTFNITEQGDGGFDINRLISAVLNSFGSRFAGSSEGVDLNQPPSERFSAASGRRHTSSLQPEQASTSALVEPAQAPIIPGSLSTLLQYLSHLRQEFVANGQNFSSQDVAFSGVDEPNFEATAHSNESRRLLTPEFLAHVMLSARQLLGQQATGCLLQLAEQLNGHTNVVDPLERTRILAGAIRSGALFQNLGALLLELGRAIMTLQMGQSPADALVNAGPSVFVSPTGPNPIMLQPLPYQPGTGFGSIPVGTVQHDSGDLHGSSVGSGFVPRNIDIRIRTGSLFSRREPAPPQPEGRGAPASSDGGNSGLQNLSGVDSNPHAREPQVRAFPLRTVVIPASVGRGSESSRGSIGILYPVLARVQHVTLANSSGASRTSDGNLGPDGNNEQHIHDPAIQPQNSEAHGGIGNISSPAEAIDDQGFSAQLRSGLEQILQSIFPGGHFIAENPNLPGSDSVQTHNSPPQDVGSSQEAATAASAEGILLSNILRQIMPIISQNAGAESNFSETLDDENPEERTRSHRRGSPQSQQSPKRQRRE